jgi:predicted aspartyl protease
VKRTLIAGLTLTWTSALVLAETNPWIERVEPAIAAAHKSSAIEDVRAAFEATYRADDWQAGLELAEWTARKPRLQKQLVGYMARARHRAGQIFDAEDLIERVQVNKADPVTLEMLIGTHLSRGKFRQAARAARELDTRTPRTTGSLLALMAVTMHKQDIDGMQDLVKEILATAKSENGYPDIYVVEGLDGLDEFLGQIGDEPLNQIRRPGKAELVRLPLVDMMACRVKINGHGPYNMILDTGGSMVISLDETVAEEISIESLGEASIRGVSGKSSSSQVLLEDVRIGNIRLRRVAGRVFDVHTAAAFSADGIIGTGIFNDGRMTLDLEDGELELTRSKTGDAPGEALAMRLIGDSKIMTDVRINGKQQLAFWDTGASINLLSPTLLRELSPSGKIEPIPGLDQGLGIMGVGGESGPTLYQGSMIDMRFGRKQIKQTAGLGMDVLDTVISPVIGVQTNVLIGLPTVRELKSMTVDFPRRKMWVDWVD